MAKKNSTASKNPMVFNSVILINADNLVSLANSLPKTRMNADTFVDYMEKNFQFGGKLHGKDFIGGSNYSTVVRQLGLYHILNNEYIPRFYSNIDRNIAETYLRYWLKLYVLPNPTSQPSLKNKFKTPKYLLKELILFIQNNPTITNIYDIIDQIYGMPFSRNDKGNLPNVIKNFSECILIDNNNNATLKSNYKNIMANIDKLINDPNRYFEHFGKDRILFTKEDNCKQQIFYGAPGTGKSHKIKECTEGDDTVIRTTFHPDSDYSTFVGTYKPIMGESKPIYGFDASGNTVMVEYPKGTIVNEQKIEYKFVQQAFTKAYIQAWKKMSMYKPMNMTFNMGSDKYVIIGIDDESIKVGKVGDDNTEAKEGADDITIKKSELNDSNDNKIEQQNNNEQNSGNEIKQTNDDTAPKPEVDDNSENKEKIIKEIKGKIKEIDTNSFDEAWNKLKNGFINPQFLIIEEINRGNCAQIFGDLFQLLDRKDGYSEYPIEPDEDLRKELEKEFSGLNLDTVVKNRINSLFKENYPNDITDKILKGELLVLPENLYIWATMNTSDQSLFPMDSAFKRRWEWKYIKITKGKDKDGKDLNWKLKYTDKDGNEIGWWEFINKINDIIASMTSSADKQLGYFFCKADDNGIISEETFVSKVLFYLWNDVFKDYGFEDTSLFRFKDEKGEDQDLTFPDFYNEDGDKVNTERVDDFVKNVMIWNKKTEEKD